MNKDINEARKRFNELTQTSFDRPLTDEELVENCMLIFDYGNALSEPDSEPLFPPLPRERDELIWNTIYARVSKSQ